MATNTYSKGHMVFDYIKGIKYTEGSITCIDLNYTGKVETDIYVDSSLLPKCIIHLYAYMKEGVLVDLKPLELQHVASRYISPEFAIIHANLSGQPLRWRPYGKFI